MPIPADNPLTVEGVALGRKLFYEKKLSDNMTISCGSCHRQENGFNDPRPFSAGTDGSLTSRSSMSLVNIGWSSHFFWDGRKTSIEAQIHDPVVNPFEMRNTWPEVVRRLQNDPEYPELFLKAFGTRKIDSLLVMKAIAQFVRTLVSFNSRFDKFVFTFDESVFNESEKRGYLLYNNKAECFHCHTGPLLTDNTFRNNGLDRVFKDLGRGSVTKNPADYGKFKVPSLRNIAVQAPYMHDGRFATLEQALGHYNDSIDKNSPGIDFDLTHLNGGLRLTPQEFRDLINFLKTFTDSTFLTNPAFSDPNK
jgi:Cytochrome c peroxidase